MTSFANCCSVYRLFDMTLASFTNGAEIHADNLVTLRHLARQIPLRQPKKVFSDQAGLYTAKSRGRGLDFSEVRQYQAGDDIRTMDWRVTARTGRAHIKLFHQERERPVLLVCDLRSHMYFGSRNTFKSVLAADITALLAWSALQAGDRIGCLLFNDDREVDLRPKTGRKQVLKILHQLSRLTPNQATDPQQRMQQIMRHVRRIARPGTAIYFLSDWLGFDERCQQLLYPIRQHSDVFAFAIYDPLDQALPPPGHYSLTNGRQTIVVNSHDEQQRRQYQQAFEQRHSALQQAMRQLRAPCIRIATEQDPLPQLRQGFGLTPIAQTEQSGHGAVR